jgi:drug/metabolite transporter superfamily protein YnfA
LIDWATLGRGSAWLVVCQWLWLVDGITPGWRDVVGVALALCGAAVIASGSTPR